MPVDLFGSGTEPRSFASCLQERLETGQWRCRNSEGIGVVCHTAALF